MTRSLPSAKPLAQRGYSLIEVMIAAGLMAGVLLSISTMFIAGTQSVRSGRDLTRATTLAASAMEEVMTLPYESTYSFLGAAKTDESTAWDTELPNPTMTGTPEDVALWTEMVESWREEVEDQLQAGVLSIRIDGIDKLPTPGNDGLKAYVDATYLRVTITVTWRESRGRDREVVFEGLAI